MRHPLGVFGLALTPLVASSLMTASVATGTPGSTVAGGQPDNIVLQWNAAALQAVRDSTLGPPMVARAFAVMHTCMYDAWAAYDRVAVGTRYGASFVVLPASGRCATSSRRSVSRRTVPS